MIELAQASWPDLPDRPLVFVPVGSTEQHGPHLPLMTDTVVANAVARALATQAHGYVAPALGIGASGEHQDFPGVMSIGTEALQRVLIEVVRSLRTWTGKVVLVNGHGGNIQAVTTAVTQLQQERHDVTWVPCHAAGDAHAGRTETSVMLHLAPWLVRPHRYQRGNTAQLRELLPDLVNQGVRGLSPNGVLGDPHGATAQEGARLFHQMVKSARHAL